MSQLSLGASVTAAHRFLRSVHSQTAALIGSLDRLMAGEEWESTNTNVTSGVGASLNAERWLVDYLYRFYFTNNEDKLLTGVVVWFDPPDSQGRAEPECLAFAARFARLQTHASVYNDWEESAPVFDAVRGMTEFCPVDAQELRYFLPHATACSAFVVPLCGLSSEEVLRTRIVEPMLAAAGALAGA